MKRIIASVAAGLGAVLWNFFWLSSIVRCRCEDSWIVSTRFQDVGTTSMIFLVAALTWMIAKKEKGLVIAAIAVLNVANPFAIAMLTNFALIPSRADAHVWIHWSVSGIF